MPIYEYQCDACDNVFEELILGSEKDPEVCPACGADRVHRVISNTSFQLKGDGWYVTDYKSNASGSSSSTTSSEPSDGGSGADSTGSSESSSGSSDDSSAA
jgi:putative FmdB family regulatory protein